MNRLIPIYLVMYFFKMCGEGEKLHPTKVCNLPSEINESSGLVVFHNNLFATHNDSAGDPVIFFIDSSGAIVDTIQLPVKNYDWEGLSYGNGHLFIGDFGNNRGNRRNLKVLSVYLDLENMSGSLQKTISFSYPQGKHDAEALYYANDTLFIINKIYPQKSKKTEVFTIPLSNPTEPLSKNFTIDADGPITGADFKNNQLALISYGYIIILKKQYGSSEYSKTLFRIPVKQTEAISWLDKNTLYYTSEGGGLYRVRIPVNKNPDR